MANITLYDVIEGNMFYDIAP